MLRYLGGDKYEFSSGGSKMVFSKVDIEFLFQEAQNHPDIYLHFDADYTNLQKSVENLQKFLENKKYTLEQIDKITETGSE